MSEMRAVGLELAELMNGYGGFGTRIVSLELGIARQEQNLEHLRDELMHVKRNKEIMEKLLAMLPDPERCLVTRRMLRKESAEARLKNLNLTASEYDRLWRKAIRILAQALAQEKAVEL